MTLLGFSLAVGQNTSDTVSSVRNIDEVVVTAYGIKKEKKSLGYVYQDIKGTTLVEARENNVTNSLTGKVSGLQVVKSSVGPAASSKIILRGFNSLTGDNQPLIVVDGVPMENFAGANNNDYWNPAVDMGNGLSDLNPEDIENVTVLKGGAASALYGSRAGNGVILITTKTGRGQRGAGITYSTTLSVENIFMKPELQNIFSQGSDGLFDKTSGLSWGEKINGQTVEDWTGQKVALKPFNNIDSFFKTGVTNTHSLTFQNSIGSDTNLFTSASYLTDENKIPGTGYNRLNLSTRATTKFGAEKRWQSDLKVQYIHAAAENRPVGGENPANYYGSILTLPTTIDITQFEQGMDVLGATTRWFNTAGSNPYWVVYNRNNKDSRSRFMMNALLKYTFNNWLNADVRVGSDFYNTKSESKVYSGGPLTNFYSTGLDRFMENNYIASINAHRDDIVGKWGGNLSVFGQIMTRNFNSILNSATLNVPNYFSIGNALGRPGVEERISKSQINSVFATAEINYDGFWFINATARNDWASTLAPENRSFFYPSVSTSLVLTDMLKKLGNMETGKFISFAKLRASYAVTGNALGPYELENPYFLGSDPNGNITAYRAGILYNPNVVSELLKTFEFGANVRFFNRVDVDVNFYDTHATNQLINLPLNPLSGYNAMKINAGDIQNKGIEVVVNADVIRGTQFKWNVLANYSRNKNFIIDLYQDIKDYPLGGFDNFSIRATPGYNYGTMYGTRFLRVQDTASPHYGKIVVDAEGLPLADQGFHILGDQTARALLGITNSFSYKNFGFSFQVDGRFGGQIFSGTHLNLQAVGLAPETVVNGARENFVVDGVVSDGKGGYIDNTKDITPQLYWNAITTRSGNLGINEANIYDATNIRLRNVQVSYSLPKAIFQNTVIQQAKVSLSANNVWMIHNKAKGIDPESVYAVGTNAVGFENMSFPTSRSFIFNLTVGF